MVDTQQLLPQMALISENFDKARSKYLNNHPTFQLYKDVRLTIYSHCKVAIDGAFLFLISQTFDYPSDSWWEGLPLLFIGHGISKTVIQIPSVANRKLIAKGVESYWQYGAFISLVSSLESSTRTIVRTAYPGMFNDGRAMNLIDIYAKLLGTKFSKYKDLLELLQLGRNTMHNNGVYFPDTKGNNRHVTYKNVTYDFIDGQSVQYVDLTKLLFFDIAPDIIEMINDIVESPQVSMHAQIIDPSTTL